MFRRSIAVVAMAGSALLAVSDVRAQTTAELLIERFDSLCVDTLADRAAVRDAADAMGWMATPAGFLSRDAMIKNPEVWVLSSREGAFFGFAAEMYLEDGEISSMNACGILVMPRPQGLAEALDRYAGGVRLPEFDDSPGESAYGFLIVDGKAQPAPAMSDDAAMDAMRNGELHMAMMQDRPEMGMIIYMAAAR